MYAEILAALRTYSPPHLHESAGACSADTSTACEQQVFLGLCSNVQAIVRHVGISMGDIHPERGSQDVLSCLHSQFQWAHLQQEALRPGRTVVSYPCALCLHANLGLLPVQKQQQPDVWCVSAASGVDDTPSVLIWTC